MSPLDFLVQKDKLQNTETREMPQPLHSVYNQHMRCKVDPFYTPQTEEIQALLRPLFTMAWLIDDFMADNDFFGAQQAIHTRFANLKYSCSIGGAHVENLGHAKGLPGPRAILFFAPAQIKKRAADWGPEAFRKRLIQAWFAFTAEASNPAHPWITSQHHSGAAEVGAAYALVLGGQGDPQVGHMLSLC